MLDSYYMIDKWLILSDVDISSISDNIRIGVYSEKQTKSTLNVNKCGII
jgi:hypothetical protein